MRKAVLFLLLASAAAPAFAALEMDDRQGRRGDRAERAERADRAERAEKSDDGEPAPRAERRAAARQELRQSRPARGDDDAVARRARVVRSDAPVSLRERRSRERFRENGPAVMQERNRNGAEVLRDRTARRAVPAISRIPRQGTQPPPRTASRRHGDHHWRGDWRSDRRYDWRNHRLRYRHLFNFGFYRDPFGWGYQPFSIGWRLWPSYYHSRYWLSDPWQYRLPYAPPGYRWIRYYDDAILVDTWDGQVVDVIRNFFW